MKTIFCFAEVLFPCFESRSESSETVRGATCFDAERVRRLRRFLGLSFDVAPRKNH